MLADNRWVAYTAKDIFEAEKLTDGMSPDLVSLELSPDYGLSPLDAVPLARGIWRKAALAATARNNPTLLKSALKVGVDFTLAKPVSPDDVGEILKDAIRISDGEPPRPHALIVDDSSTVRRLIGEAFEKAGFRITLSERMEDALARVAWDRADVAVVDVFMPGMGGIEGLRWLAAAHPSILRVAMSGGLADQLDAATALKAASKIGAEMSFRKPFDVEAMIAGVKSALAARAQPSA